MVPHLLPDWDTQKIKKLASSDGTEFKILTSSYIGQHLVIMTSSNLSISIQMIGWPDIFSRDVAGWDLVMHLILQH